MDIVDTYVHDSSLTPNANTHIQYVQCAHTHTHTHTHTHLHTHQLTCAMYTAPCRLASYDIVLTTYGLVSSEWQATMEDSKVRRCCYESVQNAIIKK